MNAGHETHRDIPLNFGRIQFFRSSGVDIDRAIEGSTRDEILQLAHSSGLEIPREPGHFRIESSIGPKDEGVKAIYERQKEGVPIHFYELAQGMVDYGKIREIQLYLKNGDMVVWDGTPECLSKLKGGVKRMSFYNTGAGLAPENTAISLHLQHSEVEKTLGTHGIGTTNALAYLADKGATVTVESNYEKKGKRRRWAGSAGLQNTESEIAQVLVMEGKWGEILEDEDRWSTSFNIEGSDELMNEFLDDLVNLSDSFLFANPMYPGACLVPKDPEAPDSLPVLMKDHEYYKGAIVECLESIIPSGAGDGLHDVIYVDGLKVKSTNYPSIFLWSIQGLSESGNNFIRRSKDSSTAQDGRNVNFLVNSIIQELKDEKMLRKLIMFIYKHPGRKTLELDHSPHFSIDMDEEKARIIRDIWKEIGGEAKITHEEKRAEEYNLKHGLGAALCFHYNGLYDVFKKAGVPTVEDELVLDHHKIIGNITAPYCPEFSDFNDGLEYFFSRFGEECPNLEDSVFCIQEIEAGAVLKIILPHALDTTKHFIPTKEESYGLVTRLIFNLMERSFGNSRQPYAFFKQSCGSLTKIKIDCNSYNDIPTDYILFIQIGQPDELAPHIKTIEPGKTHLFIPLPESSTIDLNRLKAAFRRGKNIAEKRRKIEEEPDLKKVDLTELAIQPIGIKDSDEKAFVDHPDNFLKAGFYRTAVRNKFVVKNGTGYWQENRALAKCPCSTHPPNSWEYRNKVQFNQLNGLMELPVKEGERVIAIVGSAESVIELYRDVNTGTFFATGQADSFSYYTGPDDPFDRQYYEQRLPTNEDLNCSIDFENLNPEVKNFLIQAQSLPTDAAKVDLLLNHWLTHFVYDSSPELDGLKKGEIESQIITQIINAMRGQCNYAGTGFTQMLRFLNIPARVVGGYNVRKSNQWGRGHMKVQVYIDGQWTTVDPTPSIRQAPSPKPRPQQPKWHETIKWKRWAITSTLLLCVSSGLHLCKSESRNPPHHLKSGNVDQKSPQNHGKNPNPCDACKECRDKKELE